MKVNLKQYAKDTYVLKHVEKVLGETPATKGLSRKIAKIIKDRDEVELDLELGGECIIELDKPRLEAIEERDKMTGFMSQEDD
jgi:hypothetical protein